MIRQIKIENYKSLEEVTLDLGRFNVFIGENGSGKSNILEGIALASAADARKLDNEFLASRGIRVTDPRSMRSRFNKDNVRRPVTIEVKDEENTVYAYTLNNDNKSYSEWKDSISIKPDTDDGIKMLAAYVATLEGEERDKVITDFRTAIEKAFLNFKEDAKRGQKATSLQVDFKISAEGHPAPNSSLADFIIYSPENSALRMFEREGQILPLGINGEGLLQLLSVLSTAAHAEEMSRIKDALRLLRWFDDFDVTGRGIRSRLKIADRYLDPTSNTFDQRSANEGFLFVAFYFALFSSDLTPSFFAVDNIDASLNPKLCQRLIVELNALSRSNRKQAILTTHNPAVLDGLDLKDQEQRLFVISRSRSGKTTVRRFVEKPANDKPVRLSELFMSGALGGLPTGF